MSRLATIAVAAVGLVAASCTGGAADERTGPTVPETLAPVASTSTTAPSYDIPAAIDHAYVQKVVTAYDKALGDAIRVLVREKAVTEEFLKYLVGIYTEQEFDVQQRGWSEAVAEGDIEKRPPNPGDPVTTVLRVVEADQKCVIARADRDNRPTLNVEPEESTQDNYMVLVRKKPGRDPLNINPTPWVMSFDGAKLDNSVPRNSCDD